MIETVLKHYNEFRDLGPESELFAIKQDIDRAFEQAPLTDEERSIVSALYFNEEPVTPVRQVNSGRPKSTHAADVIGLDMDGKSDNAKAIYVSRRLSSALEKMAEFLGDGYEKAEKS
jgi:hypothetical protein